MIPTILRRSLSAAQAVDDCHNGAHGARYLDPARIVEPIQAEGWPVGSHLPAQRLADRSRVSCAPIKDALQMLHQKGALERAPTRLFHRPRICICSRPAAMAMHPPRCTSTCNSDIRRLLKT